MSEPFVGEIRMFAGTFAPRGWAFCDGQLLAVSQNDALSVCWEPSTVVTAERLSACRMPGDGFRSMPDMGPV